MSTKYSIRLITLSMIPFVLSMFIGCSGIIWQVSQNIEQEAQSRLLRAVLRLDKAISHADEAANAMTKLAGATCDEKVFLRLRQRVTITPDVRTINLARDNRVYCSSLYGEIIGEVSIAEYVHGKLSLLKGNKVTPYRSLLAYRKTIGINSILVGIDGYYLQNILELLSYPTQLVLKVGTHWMSLDGFVHYTPPLESQYLRVMGSKNYGFQVITTLPSILSLENIWKYAKWYLCLIFALSSLSSLIAYKLLIRQFTPLSILRQAVERQQFIPYLQPIVNARSFKVIGAEVLIRWKHPTIGLIPPDQFVPLAEQSGLIVPMTECIMEQVSQFISLSSMTLPEEFLICVNVSAQHFRDTRLIYTCQKFMNTLLQRRVKLVLELTERELIVGNQQVEQLCEELRQCGVIFSIDDFGTGNANLSYLKQFPITHIKIDKTFTHLIHKDSHSEHIVKSIVTLAHGLQLSTVAEGIETQEQAEYLQGIGVNFMQGYLFGRPVAMTDFTT